MRDFIGYSEANWMQLREQPEKIDEVFRRMAHAQSQAPADSIYARRVAFIADYIAPLKGLREQLAHKRQNVPHVQILTNDGAPIVIDGKLDDELWQGHGGFGLVELETGRAPIFATSLKTAWQRDSLVMAITCRDRGIERLANATKTDDDPAIWNGDVIELLIETQTHSYYQITINPNGAVTDLDRKGAS